MGGMRPFREPDPAMLIAGLIFRPDFTLEPFLNDLCSRMDRIVIPWHRPVSVIKVSEPHPFDFTSYYEQEMGRGLMRAFVALSALIPQEALSEAKHVARRLELEHLDSSGGRRINLDPGLLCAEKLVLASTKNFTHRIYLEKGVFAELTLIFQKGGFRPLPWTYPDYQADWAVEFWNSTRREYLKILREFSRQIEERSR